jgi:steroid delta-isomerase-like uncharacterized protein
MTTAADVFRTSTEHYNARDFDRWVQCYAPDATFVDLAQGVTATGRDAILEYGYGWVKALSDAAYADVRTIELGNTVVAQFNGEGVNDGPFGTFPATGKRISVPFVNIVTVDDDGRISRLEQLYDRLAILIQLGHVPAS